MATDSPNTPAKVFVWSTGRSLSTSFFKCLTQIPDTVAWHEPYNKIRACSDKMKDPQWYPSARELFEKHGGASAIAKIENGYDASDKDFDWLRVQLEADYPGKTLVITKNSGASILGFQGKLPKQHWRHTFLIREPKKVALSKMKAHLRVRVNTGVSVGNNMNVDNIRYCERLNGLWKYVKAEGLDQRPVIIDTDDLLEKPKEVVEAYCAEVGIPFTEDLLTWPPGDDVMTKQWILAKQTLLMFRTMAFSEATFASTGFHKPSDAGNHGNSIEEEWQQLFKKYKLSPTAIKDALSRECLFYEEMHKERLTVNTNA